MKPKIELFVATAVLAVCPLVSGQASPYRSASEACKKLVSEKKFSDAQHSCASAVKLAETLPAKDWRERSAAYAARGQAELGANDADGAVQDFKRVIEIDEKNLKAEDVTLASDYANLALAQFQLGDLENLNFADQNFQKASDSIAVDTLDDPARADEYQRTLKGILLNYARVKRALGQDTLARALEQQANSIRER